MNTKASVLVALSLAFALPAVAGDPPGARGQRGELRERVQGKMRTWLTTEITARVGLDAKKSAQLSEAIQTHMERKHERRAALRTEMQQLRTLVDGKASDAQLKAQLDKVTGLAGRDDDMHALLADTAKFMSVQEQAKLALAMPEIMREMRHMMRGAKGEMRGKHKRGGFGGPAVDDDEL